VAGIKNETPVTDDRQKGMEKVFMSEVTSTYIPRDPVSGLGKRISWPAVFSGTLVALATELLFACFGLFIGFTMSGGGGISAWSEAWYFVTAFVALFAGAWVAARLAENTYGSGPMHGAVTWGLTTTSTVAFAIWLFGSTLNAAVITVRPVLATASTAVANSQQAVGMAAGEASTLFLVIFGGILCGCVAALIGGFAGGRNIPALPTSREARPPVADIGKSVTSATAS
jgi:hypothetical protein